ncbi:MAG: 6-phosphogluconolactonase [Kiritimatiellae bacterium]|nr:6-phosphogluconolactonase [Kiritimatiellia bacterium]
MNERTFRNTEELAEQLVDALSRVSSAAGSGFRAIMLAGGRTPLVAYRRWTASADFSAAPPYFFLSDERHVPADDRENNAGTIAPFFLNAGLPPERFLRVDTSLELEDAARRYHAGMETLMSGGCRIPCGLLGVGADGHTASLFTPEDVASAEQSGNWAVAVRRPTPPDRISVTPRLLARVERLWLVVTGAEKAEVVERLRSRPETTAAGQAIKGHPAVELWTAI